MMKKLTFINAIGESIEFSYKRPLFLNKFEGLGDVDVIIDRQTSPYQDGSTHTNTPTLSERYISLEIAILEEKEHYRRMISRVLNPKLGEGTLVFEDEFIKREINVLPEHIPKFPDNRGLSHQMVFIDLIALNPYWLSEEQVDQLVVWEGGIEFPLELPTFLAEQSESKEKILLNNGDVETPLRIVFNGPATSPIKVINKTTNEFIQVNQSLGEGEKLEINTTFGQKRVTKVLVDGSRQNAFHFITLPSIFFQLQRGNNLIDYSTGADYERAGVSIAWRNRFLSV